MSRLTLLYLLAAFAVAPASAQQPKPAPSTGGPDIIVTGMSLRDAQAALARCLEQHCPPDKDVDATLAVAEAQFVAGDYKSARAVMLKAIARNHRFARDYPVAVSDLYRSNARVAAHLGDEDSYFSSSLDMVSAIKAGLPDSDWRVLGAQIELADAYARTRRPDDAADLYRKIARQAHALQFGRVEGYALLRVANLYAALSKSRGDENYIAALKACDTLAATTDKGAEPFAGAARLMKAKLAVKAKDPGAIDRLIETYRSLAAGSKTPVLLYAPAIKQAPLSGRESASGGTLGKLAIEDFDNQWVDISFQIGPDGKVGDVEVLRRSDKVTSDWAQPILTSIAGRRYAPLAPDSPGFLRVERYTYTSAWEISTGSHMRVRSPIPRIEMVDLSRDPAAAPAR